MALNGDTMGQEVVDEFATLSEGDKSDMLACMKAMCRAIVQHIKTNAVTSTGSVQGGIDTRTGTIS